jgi:uncharacterized protein
MAMSYANDELIDAFGNVFNCYEMPFVSELQKFKMGNIFDGDYDERNCQKPYNNWYELISNDNRFASCRECIMLPLCGGLCPKHWLDGREIPCPSFKNNLPERLRLFYFKYFQVNNFDISAS